MKEITFSLRKVSKPLFYGYESMMHGYISKLCGNDNYESPKTDYVYTNLCGGINRSEGIIFNDVPYFTIRTSSLTIFTKILTSINECVHLFDEFYLESFVINDINLDKNIYSTVYCSPVLLGKHFNKFMSKSMVGTLSKEEYEAIGKYLVNNLHSRAIEYGISLDKDLRITVKRHISNNIIKYRGIINNGFNFLLCIECDKFTKSFILCNGIGRSCGCGFGYLI